MLLLLVHRPRRAEGSGAASITTINTLFFALLFFSGNLTWRDLQHLVVSTSDSENLDENGWFVNAAGFPYSHQFGFGLLHARNLVEAAESWVNVGPQEKCEFDLEM